MITESESKKMRRQPEVVPSDDALAEPEPLEEQTEQAAEAGIIDFPALEPIPTPARSASDISQEIREIEARLKHLPQKHSELRAEALKQKDLSSIKDRLAEASRAKLEYDGLLFQRLNLLREQIAAERFEFAQSYPALRAELEKANEAFNKAVADVKEAEKRRDETETEMKRTRENVWSIQRQEQEFARREQRLQIEQQKLVGQVVPAEYIDDDRVEAIG
jgi:chromosome segregation ATPase